MNKIPEMEHYTETMDVGDGFELHFETVRIKGGRNIVRLHNKPIAKLFAAAPEMLSALRAHCAVCKKTVDFEHCEKCRTGLLIKEVEENDARE